MLFGETILLLNTEKAYKNKRYELLQISARVNSTPDYVAVGTPLISHVLKNSI
jgi:hypothetical protein